MPIDDQLAGYAQDPGLFKGASTTRVMPLEELHPEDQKRVKQAITEDKRRRGHDLPVTQAGIVKVANNYYCAGEGLLRDFMESAQRAADVTHRIQIIHMHKHGEDCDEQEHHTVEPNMVRAAAIGGPAHARSNINE